MEFLEYVVENLVEHPEEVKVEEIPGSEESVIEVRVQEDDVGKVIGKNGSVAKALRTLLSATGNKNGKNYILEIID